MATMFLATMLKLEQYSIPEKKNVCQDTKANKQQCGLRPLEEIKMNQANKNLTKTMSWEMLS